MFEGIGGGASAADILEEGDWISGQRNEARGNAFSITLGQI